MVLTYLLEVGHIAQREAIDLCGSWRLSAIICSLRKAGIQIDTQQEPHQGGTHARYYIIGKQQAERYLKSLNRPPKNKVKKMPLSSSNYSATNNSMKPLS